MPKITINLNEEDYKNFFLTYQCTHDTNSRYRIKNEECYKAPWINLDSILNTAFNNSILSKDKISNSDDVKLINNANITLSEFEHIVTTYSNYTLEDMFTSSYGLYKIPTYVAENAGMTFELDG